MSRVCWFIVLLGSLGCCSVAGAQDVLLVVNKNTQISEIKPADVCAIFKGEKSRFADGSRATPVLLKGGPVHEVFISKYCGETPEQFREQWRKLVFTGQGAMPRSFASESELIGYISSTPGAIGYVSRSSPQDDVKILASTVQRPR